MRAMKCCLNSKWSIDTWVEQLYGTIENEAGKIVQQLT